MPKFSKHLPVTSDIAKRSLWKRLYSTKSRGFRPCKSVTYLKKRIFIWEYCYQVNGQNCHIQRGFNIYQMVILGLLMLRERKILQWQNFQNKSKVTSDMAKITIWNRLYLTRNEDFRTYNSSKRQNQFSSNMLRIPYLI